MALEDFADSEVGIAVAVTALALSPKARNVLRRGLVYGLAGAMKAGDAVSNAARGVATQAQNTAASGVAAAQETAAEAKTSARAGRTTKPTPGNGQ